PFEQVTTAKLPPATPYRIYLSDFSINHVADGRLNVIDGDALKLQGMVATGFAGLPALAPDRSELYSATTSSTSTTSPHWRTKARSLSRRSTRRRCPITAWFVRPRTAGCCSCKTRPPRRRRVSAPPKRASS